MLSRRTQHPHIGDVDVPKVPAAAGRGAPNVVEGETLVVAAVDAVDEEEEEAGRSLGVSFECPVGTDEVELEADWAGGVVDGDLLRGGVKGAWFDVVFVCVCVDDWLLGHVEEVFFPGNGGAAVVAEEVPAVFGVVGETELVVCSGEVRWFEVFDVGLAAAVDGARAPACVDEFPVTVVNTYNVPGVA